jgi:DNA-binding NtrC family response regulator
MRSENVQRQLQRLAPSEASVLIIGETGTGKELAARYIHEHSRRQGPFIAINCGAFSEHLVEAELFGHEAGAFTGAQQALPGWFEAANGGTLFLDEIGTMGLETQAKILRVLQDRRFRPLGSVQEVQVDVRILAATNSNLRQGVREGRFREDLYYRLNVVTIDLPPLRSRREDIPLLATYFLEHFSIENQLELRRLAPEVMRAMMDYDWPGNVRELEHVIARGVALSPTAVIPLEVLPGELTGRSYSASLLEHDANASLFDILEDIERRIIIDKLERSNWNQTEAAEQFRIPLSTLNQKIKRLNIEIRKKQKE